VTIAAIARVVVEHRGRHLGREAQPQALRVEALALLGDLDQLRDGQPLHRQIGAEPRREQRAALGVGQRPRRGHARRLLEDAQRRLGLRGDLPLRRGDAQRRGARQRLAPAVGEAPGRERERQREDREEGHRRRGEDGEPRGEPRGRHHARRLPVPRETAGQPPHRSAPAAVSRRSAMRRTRACT
jgi:hypothetical protein